MKPLYLFYFQVINKFLIYFIFELASSDKYCNLGLVVFRYSENIEKFSGTFREELKSMFELKEYSKGDYLFKQGDLCRHLYYIEKGLVRIYYYSVRGKETTVWFSAENTLVTAILNNKKGAQITFYILITYWFLCLPIC
jgi:hypothetical protein